MQNHSSITTLQLDLYSLKKTFMSDIINFQIQLDESLQLKKQKDQFSHNLLFNDLSSLCASQNVDFCVLQSLQMSVHKLNRRNDSNQNSINTSFSDNAASKDCQESITNSKEIKLKHSNSQKTFLNNNGSNSRTQQTQPASGFDQIMHALQQTQTKLQIELKSKLISSQSSQVTTIQEKQNVLDSYLQHQKSQQLRNRLITKHKTNQIFGQDIFKGIQQQQILSIIEKRSNPQVYEFIEEQIKYLQAFQPQNLQYLKTIFPTNYDVIFNYRFSTKKQIQQSEVQDTIGVEEYYKLSKLFFIFLQTDLDRRRIEIKKLVQLSWQFLVEIKLSYCFIDNNDFNDFVFNIHKFNNIRHIDLNGNQISTIKIEQLMHLHQNSSNQSTIQINLQQNPLSSQSILNLINFQKQNKNSLLKFPMNPKQLILTKKQITMQMIINFHFSQKRFLCLKYLSLNSCNVNDDGWNCFIKNIDQNFRSLCTLNLKNNQITTISHEYLLVLQKNISNRMFKNQYFLLQLYLENNNLTIDSIQNIQNFYTSNNLSNVCIFTQKFNFTFHEQRLNYLKRKINNNLTQMVDTLFRDQYLNQNQFQKKAEEFFDFLKFIIRVHHIQIKQFEKTIASIINQQKNKRKHSLTFYDSLYKNLQIQIVNFYRFLYDNYQILCKDFANQNNFNKIELLNQNQITKSVFNNSIIRLQEQMKRQIINFILSSMKRSNDFERRHFQYIQCMAVSSKSPIMYPHNNRGSRDCQIM